LAVAGRNGEIRVWAVDTGAMVLEIAGSMERIRSLAFSPSGSQLVSGGEGRHVRVWDAASGEEVGTLSCPHAKILSLVFCGADLVATGGSDNVIRIWDLTANRERGRLLGHTGSVGALACDLTTGMLVSASFDTTVRVWRLRHASHSTAAQDGPTKR